MSTESTPDAAARVCVITGGAGGIGRAAGHRFVHDRAAVVVADIDEAAGEAACADIAAGGGSVTFVAADVSLSDHVRHVLDVAMTAYGGIDVVVHAAATMTFTPVVDVAEDDWDRVLAVNLRSAFLLAKYALPLMRGGAIVNISSVHAHRTGGHVVPYAASKGALEAFTRGVSAEAAEYGVRVNALALGGVDTPMLWRNPSLPADRSLIDAASPEDVAEIIAFLASPAARLITGATLVADNGLLARLQ